MTASASSRAWAGVGIYLALLLLAAVAAVSVGFTAYGRQLNANAYDFFFRLRGPEKQGTDRITIVAIDDHTLKAQGRLPLDRRTVAAALEKICAAGPVSVGIDIWFPDTAGEAADAALEKALRACPHAVLGTGLIAGTDVQWNEPLPRLAAAAAAVGHVHADPDVDGVTRQVLLEKNVARQRHWALALECFRQIEPSPEKMLETEDALVWARLSIPAPYAAQRALLVNFAGDIGAFPRVSFEDVLEGKVSRERFAGKAVFVGATAEGAGDVKFTPVSASGVGMPGVEIHAHLLRTLLERRFLVPVRESTALMLQLLLAALMGAALYYLRGIPLAAALIALLLASHAAPYYLFLSRLETPAFSLAAAFWSVLLVNGTYQYLTVWRKYETADASRRRLRQQYEFVSHEFRSPLTAIQGSSELISRYPLDEKKRKQMADLIHSESQRLARMVERFLDVERLEAGEMELRRNPVDLRAVAEQSVERVRPLADRKSITVETSLDELDGPAGEVLGDSELLEFALYNLLSNAVKYSPERSRVSLSAGLARGRVLLSVSDKGRGISREDAAHIFDRFYRTREAQTSGSPGLGLGLSIVREIARHHGGEVTLESTPGVGSKFTLAVPLARVRTE